MKKKILIILIVVIAVLLMVAPRVKYFNGSGTVDNNQSNTEGESADYFELIFNERKDLEVKTIISKDETDKYAYNIYSCGGDLRIKIDGEEYNFREALLNNKITMEEIIAKANRDLKNKKLQANDGGSIEYPYDTYTIIKLHKIDGNRDVYIGNTQIHIDDVIK